MKQHSFLTDKHIRILGGFLFLGMIVLAGSAQVVTTSRALRVGTSGVSGIIAQNTTGAAVGRTITGTANQITVTNGDGISGNPTLSLPQSIATSSTPQFGGISAGIAAQANNQNYFYYAPAASSGARTTASVNIINAMGSGGSATSIALGPNATIYDTGAGGAASGYAISGGASYGSASPGVLGALYGSSLLTGNVSTGTLNNAYGALYDIRNYSTGTIVAGYGARYNATFAAGGTVTNYYGNYIANPSNSGTLTTNYGLYIASQTAGSTNYAIYSAGGTNYFAGNIQSGGVVFASLGTPSNGTITYCSDCTKATPCGSGGNGALAKRLNGAWDCD